MHVIIIMPVYNDWDSAELLCAAIDSFLADYSNIRARVIFIDDGSSQLGKFDLAGHTFKSLESVQMLKLRRNLGHQRAIAVALAYIQQKFTSDAVLVMDGDGEDRPEDIPRLVSALENAGRPVTVFAERGRRIESISFRVFYAFYRVLHRILTGRDIRFGNFSLVPREHIERIVAYPELWNHYAAAMLKARLPYVTIRADRGKRFRGQSQMNFVGLVIHGLSALFASYEVVSTRLLVGTVLFGLAFCSLLVVVVGIRMFTHLAIPGWATFTSGLLFILATQSISAVLAIIFSVMMSRNNLGFLPIRDHEYFVAECIQLQPS